ncbi:MAG: alpha/beta hydrolase [Rickettsiales bacterium]|nr:alpha/beta hydrolase [Pseudomonadota bacterium]MDA0966457.1 alpha/beta hydrolase [Pseudomonadota bacterium]MDG4543319.1 alpha/beta hydrolase [Rickettsiales bacterium]MDG4545585.1 alpha/beta hydrolase [Rickettsiales bacterium]MDG4548034.1 alpha/beta hydrolase [Rickettsiales bacterium]
MPEVIINGPEGRIEARYHQSKEKGAPVAIVLHPHPQHGGTMNNKVAYNIYHAFARNGFSVARFNFRGVGRSQGIYDEGIGELADAATVLDWLQLNNTNASTYWMGGFSFGSWVGMQLLMRRPEIEGFIAVSPPAGGYDFNFLSPCPAHGLIIQGDEDSIVNESDVSKLADKLAKQKNAGIDYRVILGADHFFRTKMDDLNSHLDDYLQNRLKTDARKPKKVKPDRRRRQQSPSGNNDTMPVL